MKRWERWAFNLTALAVAASGFLYFWMKYLVVNEDPFALLNHPWEGTMLHLHVLASPVFLLIFGIVLNSHVMKKLRATRIANRKSGLVSFGTFSAMVVSGYLLQVVTAESWLHALVTIHVASGVVFTGSYASHLVVSSRLARRTARSAVHEVA